MLGPCIRRAASPSSWSCPPTSPAHSPAAACLGSPAASSPAVHRYKDSYIILILPCENFREISLTSPGTEDTEQEELRPGRELAQHDHEGREDGADPGQGGGEAKRGVADGRGEYLARDYVHNLDVDKRPITYTLTTKCLKQTMKRTIH